MACVYVVTNKINNKIYVGQTIKTSEERINDHKYTKGLLGKAIRKYGKDNFIIKEYSDIRKEWLDWAEIELIKLYNSVIPNGYNISLGGQMNRIVNKETANRISSSNKNKLAWNKDLPQTEIVKIKISEALQGYILFLKY